MPPHCKAPLADTADAALSLPSASFVVVETPRAASRKSCPSRPIAGPPLTLAWSHLQLNVQERDPSTRLTRTKPLLSDVSGAARPGELLVIMGPSGAGKSTLLDCISGRNALVQGDVSVNGGAWTAATRRLASFIYQDDLFYETLTVREHLVFQARLRMGPTADRDVLVERVLSVMEDVGLSRRTDEIIGGARGSGLSGGERKRLSIASELLSDPSILFVDEPTSGVDSAMAQTIVRLLRRLAHIEGRTVVATIHQPSAMVFALFDRLYLLSEGRVVFDGAAAHAVSYFGSIGFPCPQDANPADYFMDQLVVLDKESDPAGVARLQRLVDAWRNRNVAGALPCTTEMKPIGQPTTTRSLWSEIAILTRRQGRRLIRDPLKTRTGIFQSLFVAWLIGSLYFQLKTNTPRAVQNISGMLFFININQTFTAAIPAFTAISVERPMLMREYEAGRYNLLAWFIAKNLSELPFQLLHPLVFFTPTFLATGIGAGSASAYFEMLVILILVNSAAVALGYVVSCVCRRGDIAPIIGVAALLPFFLFGGLLINPNDLVPAFKWIRSIATIRYGFDGLMISCWNHQNVAPDLEQSVGVHGALVLRRFGIVDESILSSAFILLGLNLGMRTIAFLALWWSMRTARTK
ncbi:hypothetical protein P43SY_008089 [Pythium insidiosum]|uniref:ABC transporter domain-containing protein n=1 Tax=Pythium insidiosum TaxID=114742 RepID=A0AAD5LYF2_PYTIN|nr:hypothetical protein P43SY_008089 [Pythium insidiosum]